MLQWVRGELIGRGSYGRVYLSVDVNNGEMMAVKQAEFHRALNNSDNQRESDNIRTLKHESEVLRNLDHPNIVQYLGFEETPDHLSIFLEYVPGGTIESCLQNHGPFSEDVTKFFVAQILAGLEYLHSQNIWHLNIKSDNILVEPSGICKISSFGKSLRGESGATQSATELRGTLFWMAPEVVDSKGTGYDSKNDIWSVGCVALEMWTALRPWSGEQAIPVMIKLYKDKVAPSVPDGTNLSPLADEFRKKCFTIDVNQRPSASELRAHSYLVPKAGWQFCRSELENISVRDNAERTRGTNHGRTPRLTNIAGIRAMPAFSRPSVADIEDSHELYFPEHDAPTVGNEER